MNRERGRWLFAYVGTMMAAASFIAALRAEAEPIKIGLVKSFASAPLYVAQERGYFGAEGVPAEFIYFDAAQPATVAVVSGSLDFAATALTGSFYSLAGAGALKLIAGLAREAPGFHNFGYIASNQAFAAGLTSVKDFAGHSIATTQVGSSWHYALALLIEKYGFDPRSIRLLPLQSIPNIRSAISGNQADAAVTIGASALLLVQQGQAKLLGWVGDETPWQINAALTSARTANEKRGTVERFLRAIRKGTSDYIDAFADADGRRRDGPRAPEILAIISKYTEQPVEQIVSAIPYVDADARLDVKDVLHQIAWYKSQGMVKGEVNGAEIIDTRYVVPLPER